MASNQSPLPGMPKSLVEWVNGQHDAMDAAGIDDSIGLRVERMLGYVPPVLTQGLLRLGLKELTRRRYRAKGRHSIGDGYMPPVEQLSLPELASWIISNDAARKKDAASEVLYVDSWCAAHPDMGMSPEQVYGYAQVEMPAQTGGA